MKNLIKKIILILILLLTAVIIFLSTLGFETSNFNEIISKQIKITYPSADIKLKKIKIKLDLRNRNLFLSTDNPSIVYKKTDVPIKKFDIYFDFLDLLKSKIKIKKAIIEIDEFEINEAKSVLVGIKPSNLKTLLLNNFSNGTIKLNLNIDFNENLKIDDFKVSGYIKKGNLLLSKKIKLINTNFNFIADKKLILINSIKTNYNGLPINNGSIKILKKENLFLEGAFDSRFDIEQNILKKIILNFNQTNILNNKIILKGNILSKFKLNFSETLELLDYDLEVAGEINGSKIIFTNELKNDLLPKSISNLSFDKTKILLNFSKNKKPKILLEGKYSINNDNNFYTFNIKNLVENKNSIFSIDFNFAEDLIIKQLNYKKNLKKIASISALLSIKSNQLVFKKIEYKENNNLIYFENLNINKNGMFNKVDLIKIKTFVKNQVKNDFKINFKDSIKITGNFFDSSNLIRNFTTENKKKKIYFLKSIVKFK